MNNQRPVKTPSRIVVRVDATGITASNGRGGEIRYAVSSVAPGFNPLELQSAALAMCTAITVRSELRALAGADAIAEFEVSVEGIKALEPPARLGQLEVVVTLPPGVPESAKAGVVERAEQACTIANTLHSPPEIILKF